MPVGIGYDIHRLVEGRKLMLGGVHVPYERGCLGHSDADPLLHAITDALLGAAGKGDIGEHFPDTDPRWKDADSARLLKTVGDLIKEAGFEIENIDANVIAEAPKLGKFKRKMEARIADVLEIRTAQVNIKARTNEGCDALGRKEAIAAQAVVSLVKR
ncbi:2-C-methyl-D-erythritol 2,4-cyclodiphosphate synthase [bacterium]|nr:MAG: 2-C-methyl-D-erythritol 2,4-cyclodiphosphate synthase [bacterium]RIK62084.1 MAG: 2-C-methyl-D-erythritol 2,4-cyclodiphosphate synthase [Planctomycetota bacterium]